MIPRTIKAMYTDSKMFAYVMGLVSLIFILTFAITIAYTAGATSLAGVLGVINFFVGLAVSGCITIVSLGWMQDGAPEVAIVLAILLIPIVLMIAVFSI